MKRESGILLPVFSLPSPYGIGCFSKEAYEFVDQLKAAGQSYWQILPLGPTSYGDSPYQSFSTFAGNPYFISLEELIQEGVLTQEECDQADVGEDQSSIDYAKLYQRRYPLLRKAYERSRVWENQDFSRFKEENQWWLQDYALFMAVKERFGGKAWTEWAEDIRLRWNNAMDYYRRELYYDIEFQEYLQYVFIRQWEKLKGYANRRGIRIIGDIPIYVAMDSADTWANPKLFQLDQDNKPLAVAGCPPDGFSATGQLWGNPLYQWEVHRQQGYSWWIRRLAYCYKLYDVVRIDHFRGFDEYFSIPADAKTAEGGHWEKGPGIELFQAVSRALGEKDIIAEDLGYVTDSVRQLVNDSGYPGMKVLEFAFDSRDSGCASDYLPHNYTENAVVYTGTHDNETIQGWFSSIRPEEQKMAREYLWDFYTPEKELYLSFVSLAMRSRARMCVIPLQDYLGLDNRSRINVPSTVGENWKWRLVPGQVSEELLERIKGMTLRYGRWNWS
ncbi:MAG TPA: 4-alpha-glucanotransferase [Candidatus Cottocaccamicrobium excrementipullorum]|nr:4-alpha-glucanotransferase [Candidatus Cottocaccamicrobium excrementipullorum]